jgi:hypothetical protein
MFASKALYNLDQAEKKLVGEKRSSLFYPAECNKEKN